jgi:methionyl-tRNA formyltransferase
MMGTGPFAVPSLRAIYDSPHQVLALFTRPDRPQQGRTKTPLNPMRALAIEHGTPVHDPESINATPARMVLASYQPDLLVVCDYGQILKPEVLELARLGGINLHGSLLPKFRGAAPVQWAILRGEAETGNSVIQMTPGLDAGPCLGQQRTLIDPEEDAGELEARLAKLGAALVCQVVDELAAGTARPIEQDAQLASKAPRLKKEHGVIDWSRSALEIKNQIRALRPWPRAFTFWHRADGPPMRINIDRVSIADRQDGEASSAAGPGEITEASDHLLIATGNGAIEILELQAAGKRPMSAAEFLRGNRLRAGDRLAPA